MASITEILTLIVIIIGIIILPKMFRPKGKKSSKNKISINALSIIIRFGIIISILIPIVSALFFRPWEQDVVLFVLFGIIPLIIWWGLYWIIAGLKNKAKSKSQ